MNKPIVADVTTTIEAPVARVWEALINPEMIRRYMFGTTVTSDWKVGSPIRWTGVWQGRAYEDKGVILELQPERTIRFTHFSPLSGLPDTPENYHTVTVMLSAEIPRTRVLLTQDNNPTEQAREHSERNWGFMLGNLKTLLEHAV
jgi:uncharacterized protein YndB with AHSA1/START domain